MCFKRHHNRKAAIYGTGNNIAYWKSLPTITLGYRSILISPSALLKKGVVVSGVKVAALESTLFKASGGEVKFDIVNANVKKLKEDASGKRNQVREGKTKICP
jgi:hypothetical protein